MSDPRQRACCRGAKGHAAPQPEFRCSRWYRERTPLNNNRGNNRRRGRGNRQGGGGGGQQLNRIDSRARGNAPQLLEKYRKLAQDAHMNGDRVQSEYYLQFADHYFRVIADQRLRQEEQRRPRDERWPEGGEGEREDGDDAGEFGDNNDFPSFDQPVYSRREREDRPRREERDRDDEPRGAEDEAGDEPRRNPYEPPENPFVRSDRGNRDERGGRDDRGGREERGSRGLRPRRDSRERREDRGEEAAAPGLDPSLLPPAIGAPRDEAPAAEASADGEAKPRRGRPRKPRAGDDAGETLETVN